MAQISESQSTKSWPVFRTLGEPSKNWLEKGLSIFADVRAGEGTVVVLLALNLAIVLGSYYLLKTVREALILVEGGAEVKSYSAAAQAILLLLVVPAYGAFASRVRRLKLITWVTLFFVSHLILFFFAGKAGVREGVVFYIWVGILSVLLLAQFWGFANDLFSEAQGKRLFPIVGIGASAGAVVGAWGAAQLIKIFGPYGLLLIAAGGISTGIALTAMADHWASTRANEKELSKIEAPLGKEGGFELVFRDRYLLLVAILTVLLNVVNTSGEFLLGKLVVQESLQIYGAGAETARKEFVGGFYANFFGWVNLLGFLLQTLFVSRIFRFVGVRGSLFVLPSIALVGYSVILLYPALRVVRVIKILENSTDYSLQNTARNALFLPTSREAKYKAKAAVDTFFMRLGDVLLALIVFVGTKLALSVSGFAGISVVLTAVWILVTIAIYKEHKRRLPEHA